MVKVRTGCILHCAEAGAAAKYEPGSTSARNDLTITLTANGPVHSVLNLQTI